MKNETNHTLIEKVLKTGTAIVAAGMLALGVYGGVELYREIRDRPDPALQAAVEMYESDMRELRSYALHDFDRLDESTQRGLRNYLDKIDGIVASRYNVQIDENGNPTGWISENGWKPQVTRAPKLLEFKITVRDCPKS